MSNFLRYEIEEEQQPLQHIKDLKPGTLIRNTDEDELLLFLEQSDGGMFRCWNFDTRKVELFGDKFECEVLQEGTKLTFRVDTYN